MRAALLALALAVAAPAAAQDLPAGTYQLDPAHASLSFRVSHLGFADYVAGFDRLEAELLIDPANPGAARVEAEIDVTSLDLPSPPEGFLETMLTAPWFLAETHPVIRFTSDAVALTGDGTADVTGVLTLNGVGAPVTMQVTFNGGYEGHPFDPNARIGFSATGQLDRRDFEMGFGVPPEGETLGVGAEVRFEIEAEFLGPPLED